MEEENYVDFEVKDCETNKSFGFQCMYYGTECEYEDFQISGEDGDCLDKLGFNFSSNFEDLCMEKSEKVFKEGGEETFIYKDKTYEVIEFIC